MHAAQQLLCAGLVASLIGVGCGAPCNSLDLPSTAAVIQTGSGGLPTSTGGAIVDGSYALTQVMDYNQGDGLIGQSFLWRMVFAGGTIESVSLDFKGNLQRLSASYDTVGSTITQHGICGFTQLVSEGYSATPTQLTLIQEDPVLAFTFDPM